MVNAGKPLYVTAKPDDFSERQAWCAREDLNLHPLRDQILSLACLPFHHSRKLLFVNVLYKREKLEFCPLYPVFVSHIFGL